MQNRIEATSIMTDRPCTPVELCFFGVVFYGQFLRARKLCKRIKKNKEDMAKSELEMRGEAAEAGRVRGKTAEGDLREARPALCMRKVAQ